MKSINGIINFGLVIMLGGVIIAGSEAIGNESDNTVSVHQQASVKNLPVEEFQDRIMQYPGIILDVRTPAEVADGHIPGAIFINYNDDDFTDQVNELDKTKPVYVYCRSGARSAKASKILLEQNFKEVYNLEGGFLKWSESGKAISR